MLQEFHTEVTVDRAGKGAGTLSFASLFNFFIFREDFCDIVQKPGRERLVAAAKY